MKLWDKARSLSKKKSSKVILSLILCGIASFLFIDVFKSDSNSIPEYQIATVQRGNIAIEITGSGNLALSFKQDLAFQMAGTVQEVLVKEGDFVQMGQVLARLDTSQWEKERTTLERNLLQARINLRSARLALDKAREDPNADAEEIEIKKLQVKLAELQFEDAQKALEEASNASPEIVATFDGFVINVNVSGGDEVKKGTVAVTLADPKRFKVDILVNEMDIFQLEVGTKAMVQVDAAPMINLPAKVTYIAPTATIQSGVVNYKVTVEIESLETVTAKQEIPNRAMATFDASKLREGLTSTVSIVIEERTNVLLVPNAAITTQRGQSFVQVVSSTGIVETRTIKRGITDYVNTEVIEGLQEGEKVILPKTSAPTATTPGLQPGRQFFFGGPGR